MTQLAARVVALPRWAHMAVALLLGAAGALAHAPFDVPVALLLPIFGGLYLFLFSTSARVAARVGWSVGFGYFLVSMTWIVAPFQVDAAETGWMAPFALVLLAAGLALFWGAAFGLAARLGKGPFALAIAWAGAEILRAYVLTGFPWGMMPQALVDLRVGQGLAWVGPHGLMLGLVMVAALVSRVRPAWLRAGCIAGFGVALIWPLGAADVAMTPHTVRLIQPNAPQDEKWNTAQIPVFVNRQIEYTGAPGTPDLIIWPETALPYLAENAQVVFDVIAEAARGVPVVLGIQRSEGRDYFNSLVVLDATGQVTQTYDKHHLVPFGEYMPAQWLFRHINVGGLAQRASGGYAPGPGPHLLDFGAIGTALPLICYEAVFAQDVNAAPARPAFLMQLTNDAWFGARSGPQQHLAQARMRAIEQGLPMVRAANTGISAVIDPNGRLTAALGLNVAGYLDAALPAPAAVTLYARTGDIPMALILLSALLVLALRRVRDRRALGIDVPEPGA